MAVESRFELESVKILGDTGHENNVALAPLTDGGFIVGGFNETSIIIFPQNDLDVRVFDSNGDVVGNLLDGPVGTDPAMARLSNGNIVMSYTDGTASHFTIRSADGTNQLLGPKVIAINEGGGAETNLRNTDVTSIRPTLFLDNGGFVIAGEDVFSPTDTDLRLKFYDNAGALVRTVTNFALSNDYGIKVTQLGNGNVAAAWTQEDGVGNTSVRFIIYNRDLSSPVTGGGTVGVVLDNVGSTNRDVAIVATENGFAVFYEERTSNILGTTNAIVMQEVSATGTVLGKKTIVQSTGLFASNFNDIAVTRMDDGLLAVSYVRSSSFGLIGDPSPQDMVVRVVGESHDNDFASPEITVRGGAEASDDAQRTALVRFGANQLAAMYDNPDENAVQGEHLRVVRAQVGDDENDTFTPTASPDRFRGGGGRDTVDMSAAGAAVAVDLEANTATGGTVEGDTFDSIENLIGTEYEDSLQGDAADNLLNGGAGNDILEGRDGADTLIGDDGDDSLAGDAGDDSLDGGLGVDLMHGGAGNDSMDGGDDDDRLIGDEGDDLAFGRAGNDALIGGTGNDRLHGGTGDDTVGGGAGNDTMTGGGGNDRMLGGANADRISGMAGNDRILGQLGNDTLLGGGGNDTVLGGAGGDLLRGLLGNDRMLGGAQNDRLEGGAGADTLLGERGRDILLGGGGNDRLDGGALNDTMTGGVGADVFVFGRVAGRDTITDFNSDVDRIDLVGGVRVSDLIFAESGDDLRITVRGKPGFELLLLDVAFNDISGSDFF